MYGVGDRVRTVYGTGTITEIELGKDTLIWVTVETDSESLVLLGSDILGLVLGKTR